MEEKDTKEKILKGTEDLFMRFGVRSISMDDIARHLGVSKKTLYQHFADKDDLVFWVSNNHLQCDQREFEEMQTSSENAVEELAKISLHMKRHMEEINPALLFDLQKFHLKAWNLWLKFKNDVIRESVVRNLRQGIKEGYFREDMNPEIMAVVRIELIQFAFDQAVFPREKFKLTEVQLQIFDHFVFGLVTEKGRKLYLQYKSVNHQPSTVL
ncbi:MAG: TetR/AcrR family transcriptional regulator [Flammeovirgaceae bacterium]|nr:TetR/AcrR family transcriptional regulator [Flammeovirgaceae bacterium]